MFVVGLTGGIGSGKTRVSDAFAALGITLVDTDRIARHVVEPGTECLAKIQQRFGEAILLADGSLNRRRLRDIIFNDADEKKWLESLLHPVIREHTQRQLADASSPYLLLVSPLLLESPDAAHCDRILIIDAPEELQIERTIKRDDVSEEQIKRTIAAQIQRKARLASADDVIDNSGSWADTYAQILPLHEKYLQYAQAHRKPAKTLNQHNEQ